MSRVDATHDVIIIGGGPAGSTAAAVLADRGRRVLVLERERFPRYHVGESLLPYCYFPLQRIGMVDRLQQTAFVKKYSVQFAGVSGRVSQPFYFSQHLQHAAAQTWQVVRSQFDQMLLDNARERGATVLEATAARALVQDGARTIGVAARRAGGEAAVFHAPLTIDCSGRDGFALGRNGWRLRDPELSKIALWGYYQGGLRDAGRDAGATTVAYVPEKGWFWYIPLPDDVVSVGITADRSYLYRDGRDVPAIFEREVQLNPWIAAHLAPARRLGQFRVTGDYSYRSRYCAADGLLLAGDAFAFLDPVFSSGVFLALRSGEMAADAADAALAAGDVSAGRFADYGAGLVAGIEAMRKLVYAFYDEAFSFGRLLRKYPQLRPDLTDCLIGHLFRDFDPLFRAVAEFAEVPGPLPYGRPLTPEAPGRCGHPVQK